MTQKLLQFGIACLCALVAWGCSGAKDATRETASDPVPGGAAQSSDSIDPGGDRPTDGLESAGESLGSLAVRWAEQLRAFDQRMTGLEQSATRLGDGELNAYVAAIDAKLGEAKEAASSITVEGTDLAEARATVSSRWTELNGLFQAAEDKARALTETER